jgi:hypothetical protein
MPASPILPDAAIEEMLNELATELDAAQESPVDVEEVCRPMSAKETRQRKVRVFSNWHLRKPLP